MSVFIFSMPNGRALTCARTERGKLACTGRDGCQVQWLVRTALARGGYATGRSQRPPVRATRKRRANHQTPQLAQFVL